MKKLGIAIAILLLLSGCSNDIKSTLGIRKEAPDEFTVISYPPLSVPPEFNLEPPSSETSEVMPSYKANGYTAEESQLLNKISSQQETSESHNPAWPERGERCPAELAVLHIRAR